jgi:hypothetical protein
MEAKSASRGSSKGTKNGRAAKAQIPSDIGSFLRISIGSSIKPATIDVIISFV